MKNIFKGKKIKAATKAEIKGFIYGSILTGSVLISISAVSFCNIITKYYLNINAKNSSNTNNLLYQNTINTLSEIHIADIKQHSNDNSNSASTTIKIANNRNKNMLISNTINRAEVREDGNLIKIIDINDILDTEDDLIKPYSIESLIIDFPISLNAKELKIELYSDLTSKPISAKTFNLSTKES